MNREHQGKLNRSLKLFEKRLKKQREKSRQIVARKSLSFHDFFRSTPETSDDEEQEDGEGMTEIRFIPEDKSKLQQMFDAMSRCQALHPDPEAAENQADEEAFGDAGEDDEADEGIFDDAEEEENGGHEDAMDES